MPARDSALALARAGEAESRAAVQGSVRLQRGVSLDTMQARDPLTDVMLGKLRGGSEANGI